MRRTRDVLCAFSLSTLSLSAFADGQSPFFDPLDGYFDASQYLSENAYGFLPVPIIITDPAVDGGLGMMGLFFHEDEEDKEARLKAMQTAENAAAHLLPPSVSALAVAYTGNDSYFVGGGHAGFFNRGKIRYLGGGGYGNINLDFFGFGDIQLEKPLSINTEALAVMQSVKFKIADSPFFIGPAQRYINATVKPTNLGDLTGGILPPEWQDELQKLLTIDVTTSGVGLTMEYDTRDNFFSPEKGIRYQLNYLWYDDSIGSDIDYTLTEFSGLHYLPITKKWNTAFRIDVDYADADGLLPTFATPAISLRGIPAMRYQGKAVGVAEAEVIYEINHRFDVNVFAGIGKASNDFSELTDSASRVSRGVGFRYLIARRYGFKMGIDIAKGPEESVFYIQAGSAW